MDSARRGALEASRAVEPSPSNIDRVAKEFGPEAAQWAFTQWDLRGRARDKFERADEMLFLREALEQATGERLADFHASLFPPEVLVADLTVGIGGDLIAFAKRGPAVGFELDSERAEAARHNLTVHGLAAEVRQSDCLSAEWGWEYGFADPSRRVSGRRTLDPNEFSPDPGVLAQRFSGFRLGVLKLSPMLPDRFLESLGPNLTFVSFAGECREAIVTCGTDAAVGRSAVHVDSGATIEAAEDPPTVETPSEYFFDADPAAVRAHCLGTLCNRFGLAGLGDSNGYLTGATVPASPWMRPYRVLHHGKADIGATRAALREIGAATPEWKQRGAGLNLERLRQEMRLSGDRRVSVAVWPVGKSLRHTVLESMANSAL